MFFFVFRKRRGRRKNRLESANLMDLESLRKIVCTPSRSRSASARHYHSKSPDSRPRPSSFPVLPTHGMTTNPINPADRGKRKTEIYESDDERERESESVTNQILLAITPRKRDDLEKTAKTLGMTTEELYALEGCHSMKSNELNLDDLAKGMRRRTTHLMSSSPIVIPKEETEIAQVYSLFFVSLKKKKKKKLFQSSEW